MAFLEQFSAAEQALLISLPYRVGLWLSQSDTSGGAVADARERAALARIIAGHARGNFNSPFVHEVMKACYEQRADWPRWRDNVDRVPGECQQAVAALEGRLNGRDLIAYRQTIMTIAAAIAKAFREAPEGRGGMLGQYLRIAVDSLIGLIRREKYVSAELLNISVKEDVALGTLAEALRMPEA